jgi:DNA-binding MarR family transcriptional regulator
MDPAVRGAELEQLLAVLLRLLSPAAVSPGPRPGGNNDAGAPAPASPVATGSAPEGRAAGDTAPGGVAPGGSPLGDSAPDVTAPGGGAPAGLPSVTASEARALTELLAAHGIAQGQLAALLGLEKSTVSRLAAGLESKGWIRRGRDEQNHRYVRLYLTPQGRAVADRIWQAWQSRQARILAGLTAEERAGLAAGLRGVLRGLVAEGLLAAPPPPNGQRNPGPGGQS